MYLNILYSSAERAADPGIVAKAIKLPAEKVSVHVASQIRVLPNL